MKVNTDHLRARAASFRHEGNVVSASALDDAAYEIDKLRLELKERRDREHAPQYPNNKRLHQAQAEIAALRAALEKIADGFGLGEDVFSVHLREYARAALATGGEGK